MKHGNCCVIIIVSMSKLQDSIPLGCAGLQPDVGVYLPGVAGVGRGQPGQRRQGGHGRGPGVGVGRQDVVLIVTVTSIKLYIKYIYCMIMAAKIFNKGTKILNECLFTLLLT